MALGQLLLHYDRSLLWLHGNEMVDGDPREVRRPKLSLLAELGRLYIDHGAQELWAAVAALKELNPRPPVKELVDRARRLRVIVAGRG